MEYGSRNNIYFFHNSILRGKTVKRMKVFFVSKVEVVNSCILVKYKALLTKFIKSGIGLNIEYSQ
jgi:hypothetical protein